MHFTDFFKLCSTRRSIRYFDAKPVEKDQIMELLKVASHAPSIMNLQPWHFHVVLNDELRTALMGASCYGNFVEGASAFIVITVDESLYSTSKDVVWNSTELDYSCIAAAEHIMLGATAMGLGSCWVSLHRGKAHELLQLPRSEAVVGGIMLGNFRKGEEEPSIGHVRRPIEQCYTFHE